MPHDKKMSTVKVNELCMNCLKSGHLCGLDPRNLRVVDRAIDVSTPIKGVVCPPQVSVDSRTTSDILLDYRDEGGRVLLRNGDQKHFCPSLSRCHPVSAKPGFINLSHACTYF